MAIEVVGLGAPRGPRLSFVTTGRRQPPFAACAVLAVLGALLITFLSPLLSVAAIVGVAVLVTLLGNPLWGLYALLFCVPFESVRNLQAGGLNVTITDAVSFCVAATWLTYSAVHQRVSRGISPWLPALLVYGLVIAISITQSQNFILSAKEMLKWGELLVAYIVGILVLRTRADVRRLLIVLFLAVLAESAVGVIQTVLHAGPSSFARGGFLRAAGTFAQPNPFAGYLNMTFPLAVSLLAYKCFPRLPMWLVVFATGGGVLVSLSRGAELASLTALAVMALVAIPRSRPLIALAVVAIGVVIALAAVGIVPSALLESLAQQFGVANIDVVNPTPDNWAVAERLAHMEAGLAMWNAHPILGVGIGNYPAAYDHYKVAAVWANSLGQAHNYYINIAAEAGIFGFFAFILFLGSAMAICLRAYRGGENDFDRAIALGGLGVFAGIAVHSFFDDIFVHGMEVQVALVMVIVSRVWAHFKDVPDAGQAV